MSDETTTTTTTEQPPQQALAKRDPLAVMLDRQMAEFQKVLPACCTPERFARIAMTAVRKSKGLQKALETDMGKMSFMGALMTAAQIGLEVDGRNAHLVPFGNEVTFVPDYKGLARLAIESGLVANVYASEVYEHDVFTFNMGRVEEHRPCLRGDRGEVYAYYCSVEMAGGSKVADVMRIEDVNRIRDKSKGYIAFKEGKTRDCPWASDPVEMGKKTVFKRLSKWLPMTPRLQEAIEADNHDYIDTTARVVDESKATI